MEGRAFNLMNNPGFFLSGWDRLLHTVEKCQQTPPSGVLLSVLFSLNVPVFMLGHGKMVAEFYLQGHHRERANRPESLLNCGCHSPFSPLLRHK